MSKEKPNSSNNIAPRCSRAELEAKIQELLATDRRKSEFLARMSHDIRTPIGGTISMLELALSENDLSEETRDYLTTARVACNSLLSLLNDILDISKIEAGKLALNVIDSTLGDILHPVDSVIAPHATGKGIDFDIVLKTAVPQHIKTDPDRVSQCLLNLAGNAAKFTKVGSVTIEISLEQRDGKDFIRFDVIDTGIGIAQDKQALIFGTYEQAEASTSRHYGGTGLGLAITRKLAGLLGGVLQLSSVPDKGSTFSLLIPTNVDAAVAGLTTDIDWRRGNEQDSEHILDKHRFIGTVLVAEDDFANQKGIKAILEKLGLAAQLVGDGVEAIERINDSSYDLVLMDMQMPKMNGYDATRALRSLGFTLPIIALTAHAMKGEKEKCLEAGCNAYLSKPVLLDKLVATLHAFLPQPSKHMASTSNTPKGQADETRNGDPLAQAGDLGPCNGPIINWPELEHRFGDDALVEEIVQAWFVDNPARIEALHEAIKAANLEDVRALSHTIKGSAALIGARLLYAPTLELNHMAKTGSLENAEGLFEIMRFEFEKLKQFIAQPDWIETAKQQCSAKIT